MIESFSTYREEHIESVLGGLAKHGFLHVGVIEVLNNLHEHLLVGVHKLLTLAEFAGHMGDTLLKWFN